MKSKIGEAFKEQMRHKRRPKMTRSEYSSKVYAANLMEVTKRAQEDYDLAQKWFLYGYMAGYDHSNARWKKKGEK